MKFQVVPSGMRTETQYQYLVSYVVNQSIAIDAGCLGFGLSLAEQKKITDVFLSHCHLDHTASLPVFLDNVYEAGPECVTVHGSAHTLEVLQKDILNDRIWPDFISLSTTASPFLKLDELSPLREISVQGLRVTPLALRHVVPTLGYIIADQQSAVAVISDTHHEIDVLSIVAQTPNLKAIFLECSFPNSLDWLADKAQHLIPATFAQELKLLPQGIQVLAIHIKPVWYETVVSELLALGLENLEIAEVGKVYAF